jgi:hypothetical protein
MKKRVIALALLAVLTLSLPAVAEPLLKLVPVQWYAEDGEYTLTQNAHSVTVTQEWLDAQGVTLEQLQGSVGVGLASETVTAPLPNASALLAGTRVVSVLPDGETLLLDMDGAPMLFDCENLRAVGIDLTRCKRSESLGYSMVMKLHEALRSPGIGRAGFLWSPDGRYALVSNAASVLTLLRNPFGMTLLDARDGALYMAEPGGKMMEMGTVVQQACFDGASGLLFCVVTVDGETQLRSYNPDTAEWKSLCALEGMLACEGMGWDARGNLEFLMYEGGETYRTTFSAETGRAERELLSVDGFPAYFAVTPAFTLLTAYDRAEDRFRQYSLAGGDIRLIAVSEESGAASARLAPAGEEQAESLALTHAALSSDGRRALLVTRSGRAFSAFLMDTSTLALTSVDISALADDMVEHPGFAYGNVRWQPGLCFTGGDRYILFPYLDGGTVLCELAETTENGGSTR